MARFFTTPAFKVLLGFVLFLAVFHCLSYPVQHDHDTSSAAAVEYWTAYHVQYGVDAVQNVGPLGFINFPELYSGFLSVPKLVLTLLLSVALAVLTIRTAWMLPGKGTRMFFVFLVFLFTEPDVQNYLLTLLIGYALYFSSGILLSLALIALLAILSLAKSTLLFIAVLIVIVTSVSNVWQRHWVYTLLLPLYYVALLIITWQLSGQPIENIPDFIQNACRFTHGYNEALSFFESESIAKLGFASMAIACAAIFYYRFMRKDAMGDPIRYIGLMLIEGAILFTVWKHGFTRADAHVTKFFGFLAVASPLFVWLSSPPGAISKRESGFRSLLVLVIFILCISGFERTYRFRGPGEIFASGIEWQKGMKLSQLPLKPIKLFGKERQAISDNWAFLTHIHAHLLQLDHELKESIGEFQLPRTNSVTSGQEVSYFGSLPGVMLYNHFYYRPMPATISFAAWNAWIMQKDAAFFRDDSTAPRYVLYNLSTMDNRMVAQDDSLAQLELLQHYDVLFTEKNNVLLQRRNGAGEPVFKHQSHATGHSLGEWVELPAATGPVWMQVNVPNSLTKDIISAFYKPPQYEIEYVLANGQKGRNKFIPSMALTGFMTAPFITNNQDFLSAHQAGHAELSAIARFRLLCVYEQISCSDRFSVSLSTIEGLQSGHNAPAEEAN